MKLIEERLPEKKPPLNILTICLTPSEVDMIKNYTKLSNTPDKFWSIEGSSTAYKLIQEIMNVVI